MKRNAVQIGKLNETNLANRKNKTNQKKKKTKLIRYTNEKERNELNKIHVRGRERGCDQTYRAQVYRVYYAYE